MKRFTPGVALGILAACTSSPPIHYYTLTDIAADHRLEHPVGELPVRLDRVNIPAELDRTQLVRRIDATQLQILDDHRWAAPLDAMIHRVLSADLAARLPPGAVADPNEAPAGQKRQSLSVDIQDFYADTGCSVTLRAAWMIRAPEARSRGSSAQIHLAPGGNCSGAASLPAALSQALAQLSERLAASIAAAGAGDASTSANH